MRARLASLPGQPPAEARLVCLDTETTGLGTAAGTLAFLVGLGWWEGDRFRQVQLLCPDHADEPALLAALDAAIPPDAWLVTYNGRGFDWPLLVTRYRLARRAAPVHAGMLDLLPHVRRLFRHRLGDARLATVERELLGVRRDGDVGGWEIPERYLAFVRGGSAVPLAPVVEHNAEDVRSLGRLLVHLDQRYADPDRRPLAPSGDLVALARGFTRERRHDAALGCLDEADAGWRSPAPGSGAWPSGAALPDRHGLARADPRRARPHAPPPRAPGGGGGRVGGACRRRRSRVRPRLGRGREAPRARPRGPCRGARRDGRRGASRRARTLLGAADPALVPALAHRRRRLGDLLRRASRRDTARDGARAGATPPEGSARWGSARPRPARRRSAEDRGPSGTPVIGSATIAPHPGAHMPPFDVEAVRAQFPALRRLQDGRPVVFLDGPGGTQVPDRVIDAVAGYYRTMNANSGGAFITSQATDALAAAAHAGVAAFLGAASPDEVKFGANMTTLTFHVSRAIGATLAAGDEIVVTTLDHEANVSPWRALAADRGLVVRTVDIHPEDGTLDLESLDAALGPRTRLVAFGYASNALGTVNPVREIVRRAHAAGALAYVDAVHFAPHGSIDVVALDADFLVCSVYKWFGPHLGALYGKAAVLDRLPAYKVRPAHDRFETGTPSFEAYAGTLAAVDYLRELGRTYGHAADGAGSGDARGELVAAMHAIVDHERPLARRLLDGPGRDPGRARLGDRRPRPARGADADLRHHDRGNLAGRRGGGARTGGHLHLGRRLLRPRPDRAPGPPRGGGVLRLGLVHYSTAAEVDRTLEALAAIAARMPVGSRPVAR